MKRRTGRSRREREGGFALLLVFCMAAVIGITLYMELPRVAFDVQRQKEQLLMERGQQYQIAIRRYMQRGLKAGANQMMGPPWPSKIEDLENTNGRRFLRKRYLDPMTGADEWRIIHINNGVLTDSVNNKQQQKNQQPSVPGGISEFASMGQAPAGPTGASALMSRRRPSDSAGAGSSGGSGDPNAPVNPGDPGNAAAPPPGPVLPGGSPGIQPLPGQLPIPPQMGAGPGGGTLPPGVPPGGIPGLPGGPPQFPGQPGNPVNPNIPPNSGFGNPSNPSGFSPFQQPGAGPGGQLTPQQLIGNLLTQPRPGGMPTANPNPNGSTFGGGIAGFASKLDADSIMTCADHTNYSEWEFIFDPTKWKAPADPRKTVTGTPAGSPASGGSNPGGGTGLFSPNSPGGAGGQTIGSQPGQNQNQARPGGTQGGNLGNICGMEARPGIQ
jgi:hypothetical protein